MVKNRIDELLPRPSAFIEFACDKRRTVHALLHVEATPAESRKKIRLRLFRKTASDGWSPRSVYHLIEAVLHTDREAGASVDGCHARHSSFKPVPSRFLRSFDPFVIYHRLNEQHAYRAQSSPRISNKRIVGSPSRMKSFEPSSAASCRTATSAERNRSLNDERRRK